MAWLRSQTQGQWLTSQQLPARCLAVAMTWPPVSRHMKWPLILMGMVPHLLW